MKLPPGRVYADRLMTIYELPGAAPYFETVGGPCRVAPVSRETVTTDCAAPARLLRRELFFDGWRATIDGRPAPILPADPVVQAIEVPAGVARIEFRYSPPYAVAIGILFAAGLLLVAAGTVCRRGFAGRK